MQRRQFVQTSSGTTALALAAAAGWLPAQNAMAQAQTWNKGAFETKTLAEAVFSISASL